VQISGKKKLDAQIDFLQLLHTFCPFFGAAFFPVLYKNLEPEESRKPSAENTAEDATPLNESNDREASSPTPTTPTAMKKPSRVRSLKKAFSRTFLGSRSSSSSGKPGEAGGNRERDKSTSSRNQSSKSARTAVSLQAAVTQHALYLIVPSQSTSPPVILRHQYSRILRYSLDCDNYDKFTYYVVKEHVTSEMLQEALKQCDETVRMNQVNGNENSAAVNEILSQYCDIVQLSTLPNRQSRMIEFEHTLRSYINMYKFGELPCMPGCIEQTLMPVQMDELEAELLAQYNGNGSISTSSSNRLSDNTSVEATTTDSGLDNDTSNRRVVHSSKFQQALAAKSGGGNDNAEASPNSGGSSLRRSSTVGRIGALFQSFSSSMSRGTSPSASLGGDATKPRTVSGSGLDLNSFDSSARQGNRPAGGGGATDNSSAVSMLFQGMVVSDATGGPTGDDVAPVVVGSLRELQTLASKESFFDDDHDDDHEDDADDAHSSPEVNGQRCNDEDDDESNDEHDDDSAGGRKKNASSSDGGGDDHDDRDAEDGVNNRKAAGGVSSTVRRASQFLFGGNR
jgi:hypothetical protein